MRSPLRSIAFPAALAAAALFAAASPAAAHDWGRGLRPPHAVVAFDVGYPAFPHRVFYRAHFGFGFFEPVRFCAIHGTRHAHWVPVHRFRSGRFLASPRFHGRAHHRAFRRRD